MTEREQNEREERKKKEEQGKEDVHLGPGRKKKGGK